MELEQLNFPQQYDFTFRKDKNTIFIYDSARKKWLQLSPEEWVRQHWVRYFMENKGYFASALLCEKKIELNGQTKRIDLLVTEKSLPKILVECKAPHIQLTEKTFEQTARYNSVIGAEKIILSNGIHHIFAKYENEHYTFKPTEI